MSNPASRAGIQLLKYASDIETYGQIMAGDHSPNLQQDTIVWLLAMSAEDAAKWSYLAGNGTDFGTWSRIAAESWLEYLTGDWRLRAAHEDGTIDACRWFRQPPTEYNTPWVVYLADGLCYAAVGGHWDLVDRLLEFPEPTIMPDDDGKAAHGYYLGLARWWKNAEDLGCIPEVKALRGAGSKGYHLLCDGVAAIAAGDKKALEKALAQHVAQFIKRRDHEEQFPVEATFLWHVARRKGMRPDLPEESEKYIFIPLEEYAEAKDSQ